MATIPSRTAIRATGLRKSFGEQVVLDGVDLEVPEGVVQLGVGAVRHPLPQREARLGLRQRRRVVADAGLPRARRRPDQDAAVSAWSSPSERR